MINCTKKLLKYSLNYLKNTIQQPIIVLLYHRVADLSFDPQLLSVSIHNFREQLLFLKRNYEILRFEDEWVKNDQPTIMITFDDGYADNYQNVLPILEELKIPATFFISTGMVGSDREFWWDDLERLILIPDEYPSEMELHINGKNYTWNLSFNVKICDDEWDVLSEYVPSSRCQLYKDLHCLLKSLHHEQRNTVLSMIAETTNQKEHGRLTHRALTKAELVLLASSEFVTIGAHTCTHPQLSGLNSEEQEEEILISKITLEKWLNKTISVFSYPFGSRADYDINSVSVCRRLKFIKVASNNPGQYHSWTDPMQIPRQIVRDWDSDKFQINMDSFLYY